MLRVTQRSKLHVTFKVRFKKNRGVKPKVQERTSAEPRKMQERSKSPGTGVVRLGTWCVGASAHTKTKDTA